MMGSPLRGHVVSQIRNPARKPLRASTRKPDPVLQRLGERVRNLRAIRGMSRKALAKDAGVSERFLADLETGVGNASVLLLNKLAEALALPLAEILGGQGEARADLTLSMQILSSLSTENLEEARKLLQARFIREGSAALRSSRIALIGLRGAGKSTLGALLAKELHCRFIELDKTIEELSGMDTAQIHVMLGQSAYRRYERQALETTVASGGDGVVIATPGSIVSEAQTYSYLLASCFTVWIKASPEEHMARVIAQGDMRPMAGNREAMDDLRRILSSRDALYAKADVTVDTRGKTVAAAFEDLRKAVAQRAG
ncbi:MAG TPA: helix-turn-helix transcriptional regulator [Steroidobacteraceae bacterium]|nr:helix-turn-helix transcriptional regulator [Steroidobacteraceae bacterium]